MVKNHKIALIFVFVFLLGLMDLGDVQVKAATVVTDSREGRDGEFTYSLWKDYGDTQMTLNGNGKFECSWKNIGNALFREGIKFDCTKTYKQIGDIKVKYGVDYKPDGNSYMCVYGWSRNPLIEYYIVDSWGTWRPPGAESKGRIEVDGGTYDIYETTRVDQPSIDGNTTFKQYWSVRTSKRTSGTISVTEHFKAWDKLGMNLGNLYEVSLTIEGYQSNGSAEVYTDVITIDDSKVGDDKEAPGTDNRDPDDTGTVISGTETFECESMSLSGKYAGVTYSPFNGASLYANDDQASCVVNFSSGSYDFTLRGASDGDSRAEVDLVIGNSIAGTFSFSGTSASDRTIKNVSVKAGTQDVKLVLKADDGTWDIFMDRLTITKRTASSKPLKPVVKASEADGRIKITIDKTKTASGYRVYVKAPGSKKYKKLKTVAKNGKKVRTYTFAPVQSGKYSFKVKAYKKTDGKKVWGDTSKAVQIVIP